MNRCASPSDARLVPESQPGTEPTAGLAGQNAGLCEQNDLEAPSKNAALDSTLYTAETADLDGLDADQQVRLVALLDEYLINVEEGRGFDVDHVVQENPDLRAALEHYLHGLQLVRDAAGGPAPGFGEFDHLLSGSTIDKPVQERPDLWLNPPSDRKKSRLGPYQLDSVIGRGAMGVVYRARDLRLQRDVAVKVLAFGSTLDASRLERFRTEVQAAAALDHAHVVSVYDIGHENNSHYYAMRLIEGDSLDRRLAAARRRAGLDAENDARQSNFDERLAAPLEGGNRFHQIARFCSQAAFALDAAHRRGIIHRDVKPSNLILDHDHQLYIADFGLALVQSNDRLTQTGELVGTVRYMSPEQAKGDADAVGPRTDVYGLGATLYELVTLRTPHQSQDAASLLREIQLSEPQPPSRLQPEIPRDLETIICRALRPRLCDRYASAKAMAEDLQRFADGLAIHASSVSLTERLANKLDRHRRAVATFLLVLLIATVGAGLYQRELIHERNTRRAISRGASLAAAKALVEAGRARLDDARVELWTGTKSDADEAFEASIDSLQTASEAYNELAADGQDVDTDRAELSLTRARAFNEWAAVGMQLSQHRDALARLDAADASLQRLETIDSQTVAERDAVAALVANNRAIVLLALENVTAAISEMKHALTLLQPEVDPLEKRVPSRSVQLELASAYANLSELFGENEDHDRAAEAARASLQFANLAARDDGRTKPSAIQFIQLAVSLNNLASAQLRSGATADATKNYQRAVSHLEQACRAAPRQMEPRSRLATTLNNLGIALSSVQDYHQAEQAFTRAIDLAEPGAKADPEDAIAANRVAGIGNNLGAVLLRQGKREAAEEVLRGALEHQANAVTLRPADVGYRRTYQQIIENLEQADRSAGKSTSPRSRITG